MKLLYDFGQYDDTDLVEFEIYSLMVKDFIKIVGKPIAIGEFKSKAKKRNPSTYLKKLIVPIHDKAHYEKYWEKRKKQREYELLQPKMSVSFSGLVMVDEADQMEKQEYARYMTKDNRKKEKHNDLIYGLLGGLEIYES